MLNGPTKDAAVLNYDSGNMKRYNEARQRMSEMYLESFAAVI